MKTPELYYLALVSVATLFMWVPYMLARILTRGLVPTLGNPADARHAPDPAWAERARRAHANAVENLVVFAPLVLALALSGISTPATVLASQTYLGARLVHYAVYAAGIPAIRTLAFGAGVAACLVIGGVVLGAH